MGLSGGGQQEPSISAVGLGMEDLLSGLAGTPCKGSVAAAPPPDNPPGRRGLPGGWTGSCSGPVAPRPSCLLGDRWP